MNSLLNLFSRMKSLIHGLEDFVFRVRNRIRRLGRNFRMKMKNNNQSDSQETFYVEAVNSINANAKIFLKFRRYYDYREILEHVSYKLGRSYVERIKELDKSILNDLAPFEPNDWIGKPRMYRFGGYGEISPTTIRYISVAVEIRNLFGDKLKGQFIEIGAGYGGQYLVLRNFYKVDKYFIFDLREVQTLIRSYLRGISGVTNVEYAEFDSFKINDGSIIISNYAFSELPRALQLEYIERVMKHCQYGYLIMNSGRSNMTGRSVGKLSLAELKTLLPEFEIFEEIPSTSADNYVIAWGHR